jgi:UDP-glucose 4-epimerase
LGHIGGGVPQRAYQHRRIDPVKIAVFGGGGFIGSAICDELLAAGHSLRVFERPRVDPYRPFEGAEEVEWIAGDMSNSADVDRTISGVDAVIHLVSTTLPKISNEDPAYDVQSNLVATLHLLDAMVAHSVRRIVFISSGGTVYGNPAYLPVDEKHPTNPRVSYGIVKLAIEKYLLLYQELHGIKATILRVSNPFGERQRVETAQGAVAVFLHRALQGQPIEIWGDGSVTRDYLYVGDVARAFARALDYQGTQAIFNISSGTGTSINELLHIVERTLGRPAKRRYLPGRPFDVKASVLNNALARDELGWQPTVALDEGIRRTAGWMQQSRG